MKYLSIILLLLTGCLGVKGQNYAPLPNVDTISVWFLVVDTTHAIINSVSLKNWPRDTTLDWGADWHPIVIPGFIARVRKSSSCPFEEDYMEDFSFLDNQKRILSKSILIWDQRQRK